MKLHINTLMMERFNRASTHMPAMVYSHAAAMQYIIMLACED